MDPLKFDPHPRPPLSSPPSSPAYEPDSSPPGSPDPVYLSLNDHGTPCSGARLLLGGSYKQTQPHPQYELRGEYPTPTRPARAECTGYEYAMTSMLCREPYVLPAPDQAFIDEELAAGRARVDVESPHRQRLKRTHTQVPRDDEGRWGQAVQDVIERRGNTTDTLTVIDLSGDGSPFGDMLTSISSCVAELGKLVVLPSPRPGPDVDVFGSRPFTRNRTAPASPELTTRVSSFARTGSHPAIKISEDMETDLPPIPNHEIHLFLYSNAIPALPDQLFELMNLTILSLRNNCITIVPPGISFLINLRDLNLATNKLEYLPAEMLQMSRLTTLTVAGNPFRTPPESPAKSADPSSPASPPPPSTVDRPRLVSPPFACTAGPPKLAELCLRRLLAPHADPPVLIPLRERRGLFDRRREVWTEVLEHYHLPIQPDGARLSPHSLAALRACAPDAVAGETAPGSGLNRRGSPLFYGLCPSPRHIAHAPGNAIADADGTHPSTPIVRRAFYEHAEERLTWETRVGQASLGTQGVPLLWRGCSRGCLDFLDDAPAPLQPAPVQKTPCAVTPARLPPTCRGRANLVFDEDF